jgi:hypothetical protein
MFVDSQCKPAKKWTLMDNASNLLTSLLSGGSMGSMPIVEGAVSGGGAFRSNHHHHYSQPQASS